MTLDILIGDLIMVREKLGNIQIAEIHLLDNQINIFYSEILQPAVVPKPKAILKRIK